MTILTLQKNLHRNLAIGLNNKCFVELATQSVSASELQAIEEHCNEAIRSHIPMTPRWYQPGTPELEKVYYMLVVLLYCGLCEKVILVMSR